MALPHCAHVDMPWRIHELTPDFRVEDVWALPTPGVPEDFPRLMAMLSGGGDPSVNWSRPARALWRLRWWIGARLFTPVYRLADEFAAEMANRTVHTVMHIGWVPDGNGGHRGQMAVLVKPNGPFGALYMALIAPLRHLIVYPAMLAGFGRRWRELEAAA